MREENKDGLLNTIIFFAVILNMIFYTYMIASFPWPSNYFTLMPPPPDLIYGTENGPITLDPLDAMDPASKDVINQVIEPLFWYNLTDPNLPLEPLLVSSYWWDMSKTELTMFLKTDVYFHNKEKFNASAVKWNMDRILYFINWTGTLDPVDTHECALSELYFFDDGMTPIINETIINSEFSVTIKLNAPFGPFTSLLAHISSGIVYPDPNYTTNYISIIDDLIGTGPYEFDYYIRDQEVRFSSWYPYWRPYAELTEIYFLIIEDDYTRNQAILSGDINFLTKPDPSFLNEFYANPYISVVPWNETLNYYYIAFNTKLLNVTWRKVISYTYNYTSVVQEIGNITAVRGFPAVPTGMPGHNNSVKANLPIMNISFSRQIMQNMGFGEGWDTTYPGTDDNLWKSATFATDAFGTPLDLNYIIGDSANRKVNDLLFSNLELVGIDLVETPRSLENFHDVGKNNPDQLGLWYFYWTPNFFEAFDILNPLFNNNSNNCYIQLNNTIVQSLLEQAIIETNITNRNIIYKNLQYKLFLELFVHMPLWAEKIYYIESSYHTHYHFQDIPYNILQLIYAYPIRWE